MWGDKNNAIIMNDLHIMQNKAAKILLDRPLYSSATDTLNTLEMVKHGATQILPSLLIHLQMSK